MDKQPAQLKRRMEDGYTRIQQAIDAGYDVTAWESFWLMLLREYEQVCKDINVHAPAITDAADVLNTRDAADRAAAVEPSPPATAASTGELESLASDLIECIAVYEDCVVNYPSVSDGALEDAWTVMLEARDALAARLSPADEPAAANGEREEEEG